MKPAAVDYERSVFLNCPFDPEYEPVFRALVFAVQECGFRPRCALEVEDGSEVRIEKIYRIIRECRYGIHDISRVELRNGLPRFNVPLELGLFLGARQYGAREQREKRCLVLDHEPARFRDTLSDIAGQEVREHGGDPHRAMAAVRRLLAAARGATIVPRTEVVSERYEAFRGELPSLCHRLHLRAETLEFFELRTITQEWLKGNPARIGPPPSSTLSGGPLPERLPLAAPLG